MITTRLLCDRTITVYIFYLVLLLFCPKAAVLLSQNLSKPEIVKKVKQSVVWIHAFGMPTLGSKATYGTGTGYVVGNDGFVITNEHVIRDCNGIIIFPSNAAEPFYATVLWQDSTFDLAVLKCNDIVSTAIENCGSALFESGG